MTEKTYHIKLPDGREIEVIYKSHFFGNSFCPHLEFHGRAISQTGYKSHFFGDVYSSEPEIKDVETYMYKLIEEFARVSFTTQTTQQFLFI